MLFKKKQKETEVIDKRVFFFFNTNLIVATDCIRSIERDGNTVTVHYKSNAKVESSVLVYADEKTAISIMREAAEKLNRDLI